MTFKHIKEAGINPLTKCKKCGKPSVLTNKTYGPLHDHVYQCMGCKAFTGSPTMYAWCKKYGLIARDLNLNDCLICPVPKKEGFSVKTAQCPYFDRKINMSEFQEEMSRLKKSGMTNIIDKKEVAP